MSRSLLLLSLALAGCFDFSPSELPADPSERDINAKSFTTLSGRAPGAPLRFAVIGDTQRLFDETSDAVASLNGRGDLDFVVQIGDLTDFGLTFEYEVMNGVLAGLHVPYFVVIGNHDLLGNGRWVYERMFGPLDFSFTYDRIRFVCLDTNSLEFDFAPNVPDLAWLEAQLGRDAEHDRAVVLAHVPPDASEFNPALREPYYALLAGAGVKLSVYGHLHRYELRHVNAMSEVIADIVSHRNYLVLTAVTPGDTFEVDRVFF